MIISPIFYMGNKKKLIKKGLIELFPKNINKFIEPFGGSAIVSMNTQANMYFISDIDNNLVDLYKLFKYNEADTIINHINSRVDEYGLAREDTNRTKFKDKEKIEIYKQAYMNFRKHYNENKNVLDFYTLMFYSFSQQFRFNNKGDFNMPCGNNYFSKINEIYIKNGCNFFNKDTVCIGNSDFRTINIDLLNENDFVYLDPPYLNTTATYNENSGWNVQDENDLYELCEKLNDKHINFGLSNVFENKGERNEEIIKWCEDNNWKVYSFDKHTYTACGKGNSNAKEVFITNYEMNN